ncbi:13899_t:CDS:1, partial [Funneliformis geosporum]
MRTSKKRAIEKIEATNNTNKRGCKKKDVSNDNLNDLLVNTNNPSQNKSTGAKRGRKKKTVASSDHYGNNDNPQSKSTSVKKSYKKKQKETNAPQVITELLKNDVLNDDDGLNDDYILNDNDGLNNGDIFNDDNGFNDDVLNDFNDINDDLNNNGDNSPSDGDDGPNDEEAVEAT